MSLRRIFKTGGSLISYQGINVISQLLLPPIFLHSYGVAGYGEWLTLTAAVSYLTTLNFGLHTFTNNQVAICYNRGELEEAKTLQATALLLLLCIVSCAAVLTALVFFLPVNVWLGIKLGHGTVVMTLYLLGVQILFRILLGFFGGSFLVVGISYRGQNWNVATLLATTFATSAMAFMRASFVWIAAQQLLLAILFCVLALLDLRRKAPLLVPQLRYARTDRIRGILTQSGYFGLLFWTNFLVYQLPLILMQRILGPSSVVAFSITRTIYSMSRQAANAVTQSLGQEITELYGKHEWARLFRLYELSERVVLAMIPVVTVGTLLGTPILIAIWLHKPSLYEPYMCIIMALISAVMAIKEHKYQFQTSTNQHTALARIMFWSYLAMVIAAIPGIHLFGVIGFLVAWLVTEIIQVLFILQLNRRLFGTVSQLDFSPVFKLFALMTTAVLLGSRFAIHAGEKPLLLTAMTALIFAGVLTCVAYPLFQIGTVWVYLRDRRAGRTEKSA